MKQIEKSFFLIEKSFFLIKNDANFFKELQQFICNPINTLIECEVLKLSKEREKIEPTQYTSLMGSLCSLTCTRLYIRFGVGLVIYYM